MKIGITGHQNLGDNETMKWITDQFENHLNKIKPSLGYTCLAIGADQLFTQVLIKKQIPFIVIIPCLNYDITFDNKNIHTYRNFLNYASDVIQLDYPNPSESAFFDASKLLVDYCDILFAVWNSQPSKGLGGTADVVNYAKQNLKVIIHFNPINKTVNFYNYGNH